jgi:hypothetical protein
VRRQALGANDGLQLVRHAQAKVVGPGPYWPRSEALASSSETKITSTLRSFELRAIVAGDSKNGPAA